MFGGLVAEINAPDVPAGSSPICCDMDFTVASAKTRDGLSSVYSFSGRSVGPLDCSSGTDESLGLQPWSNPGNITLGDGSYASVSLGSAGSQQLSPTADSQAGTGAAWANPSNIGATGASFATVSLGQTANGSVTSVIVDDGGGGYTSAPSVVFSGGGGSGASARASIGQAGFSRGFVASITVISGGSGYTSAPTVTLVGGGGTGATAHCVIGSGAGGSPTSELLSCTSFGFSVPTQQAISSITVTLQGSATVATTLFAQLLNGGVPIGDLISAAIPAALGTITLGLSDPLWGVAWTPAMVNASNFGIVLYANSSGTASVSLNSLKIQVASSAPGQSDNLLAQQFGFSLPNLPLNGITIGVTGHQTGGGTLTAQLLKNGVLVGTPKTFTFTAVDSRVVLGSSTDAWGAMLATADVNNTQFGVAIQASSSGAFQPFIDLVDCTVSQTSGVFNFDWVKTLDLTEFGGSLLTLALDSEGTIWTEDVLASPGTLSTLFSDIAPNSFATSVTEDGREFIVFSDLRNATDMPRQYDGSNFDRISQVGPGAPPAIATQSTTYAILASPNGVTQAAAVSIRRVFWSAAPDTNSAAGNVLTIFVANTAGIQPGSIVYLQGIPTLGGQNPNGTYIVNTIGSGQVNGSGGQSPYFTVTSTISVLAVTSDFFAGGTYQLTLATVFTSQPIPDVEVGSQITLSGVGVSGWNSTWTVLNTPNAAQLVITNTSLSAGVATYNFTLVTGSLPAANEQVTVTGTSNGNGIFNVTNAVIQSATGTQFTVSINAPNVGSAGESGIGVINGTQFQFDPGTGFVGTGGTPILGNSGGGTLSASGTLGSGTRQCVAIFETENGYQTAPSPPVTFTTSGTTTRITATQIPIGPPNVTKRILAFTGANGANFFYIPEAVTITSNGQKVTYTATVIDDNSTTAATFTFTDAVLLAAEAIDVPGNNLFEQIELGDSIGVISYSSRLFFWGEQNKIQNFINLSFDGGYLPGTTLLPLGWTVDAVNGAGGQLRTSPLFGNSYYVLNSTGATQAVYGMIEQGAFQDYNQVAIIEAGKKYGVRVTCRNPSGTSGSAKLNIDLFSPGLNKNFGTFSLPLSAMATEMQRFTGNMVTTAISGAVPADLLLRLYFDSLPNGADCEIDRCEVYDLEQPVLSTQLRASYDNNFEAFDDVTGNLGLGTQNQQPVNSAFTMFDNLYIVKSNSIYSTTDNGTTEPFFWNVREVSKRVGTPSVNGVDTGEGWALIAGQAGVYLFEGGAPVKILPEIDPLWKTINWKYGSTLWIRNDTNERKMYIGIPIPTPNQWMPNFPANANPTQPNVVMVCNYKELMTAGAIESEGPVRLTFMGDLRTYQLGRKWSAWSIQASYADFVERGDASVPLFFCGNTETGKIYKQLAGNYFDDGAPLHDLYCSYPFPKVQEAQALGFGLNMLDAHFMTMLLTGSGNVELTVIPDTIGSPYADTLPAVPVTETPAYGDTEIPLNETGSRFFVQIASQNPGDHFEISKIVMAMKQAAWATVRGSN